MIDTRELESRVRAFSADRTPSLAGGRALLAVSGGADSIATAALLCESAVLDPARSAVAHFDHRLRAPAAARLDRAAVEALCDRYGLDLVAGSWEHPRTGEAAAREARYAFLGETADRHGLPAIVTGHTSGDQAETILMHTLRGAGLHGLRGMAAETAQRDGTVIARPMLCVSRAETRACCVSRALRFVDDTTNNDTSLLRNRVRLDLLPRIGAATPGAIAALLRTAEQAREAVAALEAVAAVAIVASDDRAVALSRAALRAMPPAVVPYACRLAVEHLLGDAREFDRRHYAVLAAAADARTGAAFQLPRRLVANVDADVVVLSTGAPLTAEIPPEFEAPLPFVGALGAWSLSVTPSPDAGEGVRLPTEAVIRRRRPGDLMRTRAGTRKLKEILIDLKVPRRERDALPVIAAGADVMWTPVFTSKVVGSFPGWTVAARRVAHPSRTGPC